MSLPLIMLNLPLLVGVYLICRMKMMQGVVEKVEESIMNVIRYKEILEYLHIKMLDIMVIQYPFYNWTCNNYGYALLTNEGKLVDKLKPEDEEQRFGLQMYNRVGTGLGHWKDLKNKKVLDLGCGRGGGLEFLQKYLHCKEGIGVDLSRNQVEYCRQRYKGQQALQWIHWTSWGDGGVQPDSMDMVISVQQSNASTQFSEILQVAKRLLKKGGYFCLADYRKTNELQRLK